MISMPHSRRKADEFASALESGQTADPRLEALVGVARSLSAAEPVTPRPEFAASLRERLMAEAETELSRQTVLALPVRRKGHRERRLAAAASAFVLIGGTAGVAAASQGALPGDVLYPIKRGIERAQTDLSTDKGSKGTYLLEQANGRLDEVRGLIDESSVTQVPGTIEDFTRQSRQGADLLFRAFEENRDPSLILQIRQFAADGLETLQALAQDAPASAQDELAIAAVTMHDIDAQASALCSTCAGSLPELEVPPIFLAAADASTTIQKITDEAEKLDNSHPLDSKLLDKIRKTAENGTKSTAPDSDTDSGSSGGSSPSVDLGIDTSLDPSPDSGDTSGVTDLLNGLTGTTDSLLGTDSSDGGLLP